MMQKTSDIKLYLNLIMWALVPSIYFLVRMHIISFNEVDINILGQLEWFDLIDETIVTILTVPLYYLLKPEKTNINRNCSMLILSFGIYFVFTLIIVCYITTITKFMNSVNSITYLTLESFSLLFGFISTFMIIILTLYTEYAIIRMATVIKLLCLAITDCILINLFKENGAAISEIVVNIFIGFVLLLLCIKKNYVAFKKFEMVRFKEWFRIGAFSGFQILLDNIIYAMMICKMVNAVNESGNYWVANNFIWGWLLIPVTCLGEIIRKNNLEKLTYKNSFKWGLIILGIWIITFPIWSFFIRYAMAIDNSGIIKIVYLAMPYYITYIPSVILDSWFISKGKTHCNFIISVIVNIIYYGIMYILFVNNIFTLNINFIILLFGLGMIAHLVIDIILYFICINKRVMQT